MKVYDYQWSASFGMDADDCRGRAGAGRRRHRRWCGTRSIPYRRPGSIRRGIWRPARRYRVATDRAWSDALRAAGLRVYQTTALFFDPGLLQSFPDARPVNANGDPARGVRLVPGRLSDARWLPRCQDRPPATGRRRVGAGRSLSIVHALPGVLGELGSRVHLHQRRPLLFLPPMSRPVWRRTSGSSFLRAMPRPRRASSWKSMAPFGLPGAHGGSSRSSTASPRRLGPGAPASRSCSTPCRFPRPTSTGSTCGGRSRRRISRCCADRLTGSS